MSDLPEYWFPARHYGWGWGLPIAWQGWLVLVAFVGLISAGAWRFPPNSARAAFAIYVAVLCAALTGICWLKGEAPRWRWGDDKPNQLSRP